MSKKTSFLAVAVLATGVLTACGADNDNGNGFGNETRPIGYYSNDRDVGFNNVNNDGANGPITEMMDDDNNRNDRNNLSLMNNNNNNNDNNRNLNNGNANYDDGYDGQLAERIEDRVERINNVDDANVIITDDTVLVGVDTNDQNNKNMEKNVRNAVQKLTNKKVRVADDEDVFDRMGNVTDDLRNGSAYDEVRSDVNNILDDLGDAVQRPFQNNR